MIFKLTAFAALLAVAYAQHGLHGHATSSQSIIRHDARNQHGYHAQPIAIHAPIVNEANPVVHHAAPIVHHAAPIVHHAAPISHYIAPVAHHVAPIAHHVAPIAHHAVHDAVPVYYNQHGHSYEHEDYHDHPHYEFQYSVEDTHTRDIKSQHEARDGDHVNGSYSLHEPDGSVRTVHYSVEGHSGFQAQVEHSAPSTHVQPAPVHHEPVHYAPVHYAPTHHVLAHHR